MWNLPLVAGCRHVELNKLVYVLDPEHTEMTEHRSRVLCGAITYVLLKLGLSDDTVDNLTELVRYLFHFVSLFFVTAIVHRLHQSRQSPPR